MALPSLQTNIPLRAIPENKVNEIVFKQLLPFISTLLSLTGESSANRLEMTIPAIKSQCIGMGFSEIVKMIEYYADGKMTIQPVSNYFDRILFGKIVNEWKSLQAKKSKPKKEVSTISDAEKKKIIQDAFLDEVEQFKVNGFVNSNRVYFYDIFDKLDLMPKDREYKMSIKDDAVYLLKQEYSKKQPQSKSEHQKLKRDLETIVSGKSDILKIKCKLLALDDYFRKITKDEKKIKRVFNLLK